MTNDPSSSRGSPRLGLFAFAAGLVALGFVKRRRQGTGSNVPTGIAREPVEPLVSGLAEVESFDLPAPARAGRDRRRLAVLLIATGVFVLAYATAVVLWRDPATDLYSRWKQHQLETSLEKAFADEGSRFASWQAALEIPDKGVADLPGEQERLEAARLAVADAANALHRRLELGQALGRIEIRRIGLNAVFVQGTRWGPDLSRGPGHYAQTSLPGVGRTMAVAGHRTTFGAPFRHIDSIRTGDWIKLSLPYATFHYRTFTHKIVDNEDWSIVRDRGFDTLVLSACHPLYSAEQRWTVFARLEWVEPVGGRPYAISKTGEVRALEA